MIEVLETYKGATVSFSGGDPLEYSHLDELTKYLEKNKVVYQVFTNLTYKLLSTHFNFLHFAKCIQVSLDGGNQEAYCKVRGKGSNYRQLVLNAGLFKNIKFNSTISKINYDNVISIAAEAYDIGRPVRFWPVHTHPYLMLEDKEKAAINEQIKQMNKEYFYRKVIANTNLSDWDNLMHRETYNKCFVKNEHRVIDENGIEYPCCRAINDNGFDIEQKYSVDNLKDISNPDKLYEFCKGCDRYVRFNSNWDEVKDKKELFL